MTTFELLLTSTGSFVLTNIDDLAVLLFLFMNPKARFRIIVSGQVLGMLGILAVCTLGAWVGSALISEKWLGLFGLIPLFLGMYKLLPKKVPLFPQSVSTRGRVLSVAAITFANGGDNIAVYTSLFATYHSPSKIAFTILVCIGMTLIWCVLAFRFVRAIRNVAQRGMQIQNFSEKIYPYFLISFGLFLLIRNFN